MRRTAVLALFLAACSGSSAPKQVAGPTEPNPDRGDGDRIVPIAPATPETPRRFRYPDARKDGAVVDDYHGTKVADPYRWLENSDDPESRAWIEAQNALTFGFLDKAPDRAAIQTRITELWNYEKYGLPSQKGKRWFYTKNDGLQNQSVLYWATGLDAAPKVLLDPNALAADGTVALQATAISDDGKYLAYGLQSAGSDWTTWKVRDVATGKDFDDELKWVKFSDASWTKDGKGFYYARYPEPKDGNALTAENKLHSLWYHRVGSPQTEDQLIAERPDQPTWFIGATVTEDGKYVFVFDSKGTGPQTLVSYAELKGTTPQKRAVKLTPLVETWEAEYSLLGNDGPIAYFKTDLDAPRGRVIAIDLRKPDKAGWKELVPQAKESIDTATIVGNRLMVAYLVDAKSAVKVFDLGGKPVRTVDLPGIGSAGGFKGRRADKQTFYGFTSFTTPSAVYRYDLKTGKSTVWRQPKLEFDGNAFETTQVFYPSKDGTKIPMFIVHKKGLALNGDNPTILYGYGGFSSSETPYFSATNATWIERGGVYAVANLRGGGEYGEEWHLAGTKLHKQNVFDDFIAAAEHLIAAKYTRPQRLAIRGASNGGLLVGAAITQRPELFGAALPQVGVMDMLRFHKFTIGYAWIDDYGSSDNADEFKALYAYSPLHNIKPGVAYPPTLVTSGDHDDRVVPGHSFKFTAALQAAQAGDAPVMIRIETKGGHGGGKPTSMKIAENADLLAFVTAVFAETK
jgi:prolyl oligopeptidase